MTSLVAPEYVFGASLASFSSNERHIMSNNSQIESDEFISEIISTARQGFGFVPLFGSGMSASSGIIMGMEFASYLTYAVYSALNNRTRGSRPWDFRQDGWPPYPSSEEYENAEKWVHQVFSEICDRNAYVVAYDDSAGKVTSVTPKDIASRSQNYLVRLINRPPVPSVIRSSSFQSDDDDLQRLTRTLRGGDQQTVPYEPLWPRLQESPSSQARLEELAIRSLCDWRMTLQFLSRVDQVGGRSPSLIEPSKTVIDRFNTFITADKQPNLGHKMLVHLARPLHIRTILTTNFDTLIESAFAQAQMPIEKFCVQSSGRLPDPFLVRAHTSIVKLHGELHDTRADLTLDDEPSDEDK